MVDMVSINWVTFCLSVILKAREYDKNVFNKNLIKNLNIFTIQETNNVSKSDLNIIKTDDEISEILKDLFDAWIEEPFN